MTSSTSSAPNMQNQMDMTSGAQKNESQNQFHDIGIDKALSYIGNIPDEVFISDAQKLLFKVIYFS